MIMRDTDPKAVHRKVKRSELTKWMKKNKFLLKNSQINYGDLRKTKDRLEWNKFKKTTITFEQICQIRNRNSILNKLKCDNGDRRMYVPPFEPMYGLKSSMVSAIVK